MYLYVYLYRYLFRSMCDQIMLVFLCVCIYITSHFLMVSYWSLCQPMVKFTSNYGDGKENKTYSKLSSLFMKNKSNVLTSERYILFLRCTLDIC